MKRLLVILILLAGVVIYAGQIKSFEDLMETLRKGEDVNVVVEYGKCKLISSNEEKTAPDAIGGMPVTVWEYFAPMSIGNPEAFVVFSQAKLINYGGFIHNYAKFKISEDGSVKITAQYANAEDYELEMDENFFTIINDGKNDGALYIYSD